METVVGDVNPVPADTLYQFFEGILLTYLAAAVPLVYVMTQITKMIVPQLGVSLIRLLWTIAFWILFVFVNQAGYMTQFENLIPAIATIIATFAGVVATPETAGKLYDLAAESRIPFVGASAPE